MSGVLVGSSFDRLMPGVVGVLGTGSLVFFGDNFGAAALFAVDIGGGLDICFFSTGLLFSTGLAAGLLVPFAWPFVPVVGFFSSTLAVGLI